MRGLQAAADWGLEAGEMLAETSVRMNEGEKPVRRRART